MTWRSRAATVLREPLMHFMVAGALVYAVLAGRAPDAGERRVVVDEAMVGQLVNRFAESFHRAPSPAEIDGLIADHVRDQVYYREALRLGLDQGDEVVMRRMRNKMIALATSETEAATPTDAQLQALLDRDPGRYAREVQVGFAQLYFGSDGPAARTAAQQALAALAAGADPAGLGQPAPLPARFNHAPGSDIAAAFGEDFAAALPRQPRGRWTVLTSGLGLHLVRVDNVTAPAPPTLATVRQQVANDWHNAAVRKAEQDAYRRLLDGYDVAIERPR